MLPATCLIVTFFSTSAALEEGCTLLTAVLVDNGTLEFQPAEF